jgi:putative ABC transport system permease protein
MNLSQLLGSIELGLVFGVVALGANLSFRVLRFPDLTADGSFALGGATAASLILAGVNPILATLLAVVAGALAGLVTAFLTSNLKVLNLLSGILTMSALYSINMRVLGLKPNLSLLGSPTIFTQAEAVSPLLSISVVLAGVSGMIWILLSRFLTSDLGLAMRAAGSNPRMGRAHGIAEHRMVSLGLAISNGLIALGGALFSQVFQFADVTMGVGTIVTGLASVIIGETLIRNSRLYVGLLACIVGAILYRMLIALALNANSIGLQASDINLVSAGLIVVIMGIPAFRRKDQH